jgi:hypothetical protein
MKAGHVYFATTGKVPAGLRGRRRINRHLRELDAKVKEFVGDRETPLTLLQACQITRTEGILELVEAYLNQAGIAKPGGRELVPMLAGSYLQFLRAQGQAIMNLAQLLKESGKGGGPVDIRDYIELKDAEKAGDAAQAAPEGQTEAADRQKRLNQAESAGFKEGNS